MTEDKRLESIEKTLDSQSKQLSEIAKAVNTIALQNHRIQELEGDVKKNAKAIEALTDPKGIISELNNHKASCPRDRVDSMWWAIVVGGGIVASGFLGTWAAISQLAGAL